MMRMVMVVLLILGLGVAAQAGQESSRTPATAKASATGLVNLNTASVAAGDTARHRQVDRRTDPRVPREERRIQEDRGPDECSWNRREEFSEAQAAHHRDVHEGWKHGAVDEGGLAGRGHTWCPRQPVGASALGFTVLDIVFAAAVLSVLLAVAIPQTMTTIDRSRGLAAARYLGAREWRSRGHKPSAAPRRSRSVFSEEQSGITHQHHTGRQSQRRPDPGHRTSDRSSDRGGRRCCRICFQASRSDSLLTCRAEAPCSSAGRTSSRSHRTGRPRQARSTCAAVTALSGSFVFSASRRDVACSATCRTTREWVNAS